ncbi:MAG: hypothetical protein P8Q94_00710, partial [Candidatus Poseidoniaceae archaeon]|nr:hypothetical protein [Candidatus Poseidoniaceae archaeon]
MLECTICGLLSLNAISCPACGSQNLVDLSANDDAEEPMPTEIPGLDDAADSWHDLEGSSRTEDTDNIPVDSASESSELPFGFQGESNISVSRLPFGIGSHAEGIPFDQSESERELVEFTEHQDESTDIPHVSANQTAGQEPIPEVVVARP